MGAMFPTDIGWLAPFVLAFCAALVTVPILRRVASQFDLYDRPDAGLKPHEKPIPFLGGLAIWAGWMAFLLLWMGWYRGLSSAWPPAYVAIGGSLLMLLGLVDDIRHLPPKLRLLAQALVAGLLLYGGIGRGIAESMIGQTGWAVGDTTGYLLSVLFCIFVLAGAANSTNMIDGLDGLCAGILGIASAGFFAMAIILWDVPGGPAMPDHAALVLAICAATVAACGAFLCYNFNPASIFMGDSGSLLLGFNAAACIILLTEHAAWRGLVGAVIVFGFPIFDTALAIARRKLNGKPLFVGDRSHFYDQLRDRGLSVRQTVAICYGLGLAFAAIGCICVMLPTGWLVAVAVGMPILTAAVCRQLGMLRVDDAAERSEGLRG